MMIDRWNSGESKSKFFLMRFKKTDEKIKKNRPKSFEI